MGSDSEIFAHMFNRLSLELHNTERLMHLEFLTIEHILIEKKLTTDEEISQVRDAIASTNSLISELDNRIKEIRAVIDRTNEQELINRKKQEIIEKQLREFDITPEEESLIRQKFNPN